MFPGQPSACNTIQLITADICLGQQYSFHDGDLERSLLNSHLES